MRPFFTNRRGVLYQADCLDVLARLRDASLDCVFADPPFNLGKVYGNGEVSDALAARDYLKWCAAWLDECVRVLKPGAALFVYIIPRWGYHLAAHLEETGMRFRHWIALSMKGTFPRGRKLYPAHYALLYFTKGDEPLGRSTASGYPSRLVDTAARTSRTGGHRKYLNPLGLNVTDFWDDTAPARHRKFKPART